MSDRRRERLRQKPDDKTGDFRDDFERDCDRILYSGAFRRLAVITQVVSPAGGHAFHNRLTHALKVAQVGRRIAEGLDTAENAEMIGRLGGLHPSVVEAAGLAHDLGHPPFGHIAEEELDEKLREGGEKEGYEGNAQSFRIVSSLEIRESGRKEGALGLNLSRATLNALLKYPRMRDLSTNGPHKFGAYHSEEEQFNFARQYSIGENPSLEAQIMDWADDISYAVHDLEDFYRAGMIPLDRLSKSKDEIRSFIDGMLPRLRNKITLEDEPDYVDTATRFLAFVRFRKRIREKERNELHCGVLPAVLFTMPSAEPRFPIPA